jgi:F0F1-type ATP synthase assembly protein I
MGGPHQRPRGKEDKNLLALGMRYAGIASQFALTLLVLGYVGSRLDEAKGWSPWGVLSGILFGMGVGIWSMLRQLEKLEK